VAPWFYTFDFLCFLIGCLIFAGTAFTGIRKALALTTAFLSHGILDFLTTKYAGGVELFYPFSNERVKLGIFGVSEFESGFYLEE
jgi:membrane-bound metal-dependent hydrolase YbcI (DUF457 family)